MNECHAVNLATIVMEITYQKPVGRLGRNAISLAFDHVEVSLRVDCCSLMTRVAIEEEL